MSLDETLAAKRAAKYDATLAAEVRGWMEEVLRHGGRADLLSASGDAQSLGDWLRSGVVLCALVNVLKPGQIAKVADDPGATAFKKRENVDKYLRATEALGAHASDLFNVSDLVDDKDMNLVIANLAVLGSLSHWVEGYAGPTFGKKGAKPRPKQRESKTSPSVPVPAAGSRTSPFATHFSSSPSTPIGSSGPVDPASTQSVDVASLEADVQAQKEFKYNVGIERKLRKWTEAVLGETIEGDFINAIRDGSLLCRLLNTLYPGTIPEKSIYTGGIAYKQMQNVNSFLRALTSVVGMRELELFETVDLFNKSNPGVVLSTLTVFAQRAVGRPDYRGPPLEDLTMDRTLFSAAIGAQADSRVAADDGGDGLRAQLDAARGGPPDEMTDVEHSLARWIRKQVPRVKRITDLVGRLQDGVLLIRLLEELFHAKVLFYHRVPVTLYDCMQNATIALRTARTHSFESFDFVAPRDIINGNGPALVQFLQSLREKYDMDYLYKARLREEGIEVDDEDEADDDVDDVDEDAAAAEAAEQVFGLSGKRTASALDEEVTAADSALNAVIAGDGTTDAAVIDDDEDDEGDDEAGEQADDDVDEGDDGDDVGGDEDGGDDEDEDDDDAPTLDASVIASQVEENPEIVAERQSIAEARRELELARESVVVTESSSMAPELADEIQRVATALADARVAAREEAERAARAAEVLERAQQMDLARRARIAEKVTVAAAARASAESDFSAAQESLNHAQDAVAKAEQAVNSAEDGVPAAQARLEAVQAKEAAAAAAAAEAREKAGKKGTFSFGKKKAAKAAEDAAAEADAVAQELADAQAAIADAEAAVAQAKEALADRKRVAEQANVAFKDAAEALEDARDAEDRAKSALSALEQEDVARREAVAAAEAAAATKAAKAGQPPPDPAALEKEMEDLRRKASFTSASVAAADIEASSSAAASDGGGAADAGDAAVPGAGSAAGAGSSGSAAGDAAKARLVALEEALAKRERKLADMHRAKVEETVRSSSRRSGKGTTRRHMQRKGSVAAKGSRASKSVSAGSRVSGSRARRRRTETGGAAGDKPDLCELCDLRSPKHKVMLSADAPPKYLCPECVTAMRTPRIKSGWLTCEAVTGSTKKKFAVVDQRSRTLYWFESSQAADVDAERKAKFAVNLRPYTVRVKDTDATIRLMVGTLRSGKSRRSRRSRGLSTSDSTSSALAALLSPRLAVAPVGGGGVGDEGAAANASTSFASGGDGSPPAIELVAESADEATAWRSALDCASRDLKQAALSGALRRKTRKAADAARQRRKEEAAARAEAKLKLTELENAATNGVQASAALVGGGAPTSPGTVTGDAAKKEAARAAVRVRIISEVLSTEVNYVRSLQRLVDGLITPLANDSSLPDGAVESVFSNVPQLLERHREFLAKLDARVASWDAATSCAGDLFLEGLNFLSLYQAYLSNYDAAVVRLHILRRAHPAVGTIVGQFDSGDQAGLDVSSYLIMPVQRIPRYLLLVDQLRKYTPDTHADKPVLDAAHAIIKTKLALLNRGIDQSRAQDANVVISAEKAIKPTFREKLGVPTLVSETRAYLMESRLKVAKVKRRKAFGKKGAGTRASRDGSVEVKRIAYAILFSDLLLFVEVDEDPKRPLTRTAPQLGAAGRLQNPPFTVVEGVDLSELEAVEVKEKDEKNFEFVLALEVDLVTVHVSSREERTEWVNALRERIVARGD